MNWFFLTIISAVAYAAAEIIGKYISDKKSEPVFIGIIAAGFTAAVSLLFAVWESPAIPTNIWAITGLVSSGALVAVGVMTYYEGLKHSDVSEFSLFSRSRMLIIVIGGLVFFQERFTFLQAAGGLLVLCGVFFLSWEGKGIHFGKGAKFALATAVLFGLGALIDKAVIPYFTAMMYTFLIYLFTVLFMIPLVLVRLKKGAPLPKRSTVGILSIVGILYGASAYCIYAAYLQSGPASLVTLVSQLEIPIAVLWGIFVMKEQKKIFPKLMSMALLILGIVLLK
ncbi:MAG: DMT family transporter [Patescibacteria group bacterium]